MIEPPSPFCSSCCPCVPGRSEAKTGVPGRSKAKTGVPGRSKAKTGVPNKVFVLPITPGNSL